MKTENNLLFVLLLVVSLSIILSCSNSTGPGDTHEFPDAIDSVATGIALYVYSDGWGIILDTLEMDTEDTITIDIYEENPYSNPAQYYIYAKADGFYTELYRCTKGDTIRVDLDAVPQISNSITGVIFEQQVYFADCYFAEKDIALSIPGGASISGTTDSLGRYGFSNLSEDSYFLHFSAYSMPEVFTVTNTGGTDYEDLYFYSEMQVEAPNIYLYPETTSDISVDIDFPNGGEIIKSEPPYNNGWRINVTPEGIIDGQYEYLFYETRQSMPLNHQYGWLLDGTNLEGELRFLLMNLGFAGREIDDFIDYWLPRFGSTPYLAVYPQDVESMITLSIEPVPDKLLRMIFLFRPLTLPAQLEELPLPDAIKRDAFTAVEWGGILLSQ
ncbi:MAG TPA: hypothetical protein ENL22_09720 [candidate division Zixibacteria bacterium]|nr:hypothetical protein [candidate division Zixibacteria bacterium]